ncbi:MAG TPA: glycosyltransferase family 4 protein [Syntrophomonas sp.]|nr:glycosyltransferase family 4 protein [Syntrophomonas sp.]
MKILYTVHQFYPKWYTGTEKFVLNSAKMQQRFGNQVKVVAFGMDAPGKYDRVLGNVVYKEFIYQGVPVLEFRYRGKEGHLNEVLVDEELKEFAQFVIDSYGPDVIHAGHIMRTTEFVHYARHAGIPYVMSLTDFWLICLRTIMLTPQNQICSGCSNGEKCAQNCHISVDYCRTRYKQADEILQGAYMVVSPSRFLASMFEKEFEGLKVRVINHGISTLYLRENPKVYGDKSSVIFCYAGSLTQHKGVHLLVKAFRELRSTNAALQIYGSGPEDYVRRLRSLAEGDKRIQFKGIYCADEIASVFDGCDVVIIPSTWYENYPLVLHESLISCVPVLASNIGGMSEKITDGFNGYTFRVGDADDLRGKMQDIVDNPAILNYYKKNISGFLQPTVEQEASRYLKVFEELRKTGKNAGR